MTAEARQREYSQERDEEDRRVLLQATLEFFGLEEDETPIDKNTLEPGLRELVNDLERSGARVILKTVAPKVVTLVP
ncbi:MAG: hypothetical protein RLY47_671 [Candidatus Parcubacteria bacterium]|jgi:phosphoserine phosphatase